MILVRLSSRGAESRNRSLNRRPHDEHSRVTNPSEFVGKTTLGAGKGSRMFRSYPQRSSGPLVSGRPIHDGSGRHSAPTVAIL